jgi:hypothetical protein
LGVCLRASCELTWEHTVKQAGSVPSSAIERLLESVPGSVLENVLGGVLVRVFRVCLGACIKQARSVPSSAIGSVLGSMLESIL